MPTPKMLQSAVVDATCGENVRIVSPSNVYGCHLGDDVFVGPFVEIQKGVHVGARTRIQSHTFICELVTIGSDCAIAHGVMFNNDLYQTGGPAQGDHMLWKSTKIGNNLSIGSNATVLPVIVCNYVVVGAGSVVTKDTYEPGTYAVNPARKIRGFDIK